jgi:hypothetical protein
MDKKYRVVFIDLLESREGCEEKMARLGVPCTMVDQIITKAPVVLKADLALGEARHYADAVQHAGGKVTIQEHGTFGEPLRLTRTTGIEPFESFTMCPECGFKQRKAATCVKCGFAFDSRDTGRDWKDARGR